jgi:hypothetical protein
VGLNGLDADGEDGGDFLVAAALGQQLDDLTLAGGKRGVGTGLLFVAGGLLLETAKKDFRDAGGEVGLMGKQCGDGGDEVAAGLALEDVRTDAGVEDGLDQFGLLVAGKDEDFRAREAFLDLAGGVEAVKIGHEEVHDNDVREEFRCHPKSLAAAAGLAADFPLRLSGDEGANALANNIVIVNDEDARSGHICSAFPLKQFRAKKGSFSERKKKKSGGAKADYCCEGGKHRL